MQIDVVPDFDPHVKSVSRADLSLREKDGFIIIVLNNPSDVINLQKSLQTKAAEREQACLCVKAVIHLPNCSFLTVSVTFRNPPIFFFFFPLNGS